MANLKNRIDRVSKLINPGDKDERLRYLREREKTLERLIDDLPVSEKLKYADAMIALYENNASVPWENLHLHYGELDAVLVEIRKLGPTRLNILEELTDQQINQIMSRVKKRIQKERENEFKDKDF